MNRTLKWTLLGAAALALLTLDAAVTWRLASSRATPAAVAAPAARLEAVDPVSQFRLEREQLRARQEAQLNDIIYSDRSDAATVAQAQGQLLSLLDRAEKEATLEGLLQARGFEDALVSLGEHSANVMLRREAITRQESAVILELALRETGLTAGNVKIIPIK